MRLDFNIPTRWDQLNEYQLLQIAPVFFAETAGSKELLKILRAIFCPDKKLSTAFRYKFLLNSVSVKDLLPHLEFIRTEPEVYAFPEIGGLHAPSVRLGNLLIEQFSVADQLFYNWRTSKDEIELRRLVAALYTFGQFHKSDMPAVANITDKISPALRSRIALAFWSCRLSIIQNFPKVFPKPATPNPDDVVPVFSKQPGGYTPFNQIIITMTFEEPQPLGNYQNAKRTNLYEFLNVLTQSIIRQEKIAQENAKRK